MKLTTKSKYSWINYTFINNNEFNNLVQYAENIISRYTIILHIINNNQIIFYLLGI